MERTGLLAHDTDLDMGQLSNRSAHGRAGSRDMVLVAARVYFGAVC